MCGVENIRAVPFILGLVLQLSRQEVVVFDVWYVAITVGVQSEPMPDHPVVFLFTVDFVLLPYLVLQLSSSLVTVAFQLHPAYTTIVVGVVSHSSLEHAVRDMVLFEEKLVQNRTALIRPISFGHIPAFSFLRPCEFFGHIPFITCRVLSRIFHFVDEVEMGHVVQRLGHFGVKAANPILISLFLVEPRFVEVVKVSLNSVSGVDGSSPEAEHQRARTSREVPCA
mmetsp:Transcript_22489/g.43778  ORF Transcript_22489/g.43778 Transcript_22489/m.43778 type:complete len:225 (+) Transcript_22489:232-906(+)